MPDERSQTTDRRGPVKSPRQPLLIHSSTYSSIHLFRICVLPKALLSSPWRRVRIGCTRRDIRILPQTLLELHHDLHGWARHPRISQSSLRVFLFWIGNEIERFGISQFRWYGPPISLLVVEDDFPIP